MTKGQRRKQREIEESKRIGIIATREEVIAMRQRVGKETLMADKDPKREGK